MFITKSGREITYNGEEYTKDIKLLNDNYTNINSIDELFGKSPEESKRSINDFYKYDKSIFFLCFEVS